MAGKLRAGIIGCGSISKNHARGYINSGRYDLVALADLNEGAMDDMDRSNEMQTHHYTDAREMMARENLDVITIILNNGSYAILNIELMRVGVQNPGPKALSMLDLRNPALNWVSISEGMGVPAVRVETAEDFKAALEEALAHKGPRLIEVIL